MKIDKIIKEKRQQLGLTQEQVAQYFSIVAASLQGAMIMFNVEDNKGQYKKEIEKLYERIIDSDNVEISDGDKTMMISKYTFKNSKII